MQLAQTYRSDGRIIGDMVSSPNDVEESYVTQAYNKNKNKSFKRKVEVVDEYDKKDLFHIECYLCKQSLSEQVPFTGRSREIIKQDKEV